MSLLMQEFHDALPKSALPSAAVTSPRRLVVFMVTAVGVNASSEDTRGIPCTDWLKSGLLN